jgi:hypothetical protein
MAGHDAILAALPKAAIRLASMAVASRTPLRRPELAGGDEIQACAATKRRRLILGCVGAWPDRDMARHRLRNWTGWTGHIKVARPERPPTLGLQDRLADGSCRCA